MTPSSPRVYQRLHRIRFAECDPAGIVFFPQYFVMLNGLIEDWFDEGLRLGYRKVVAERRVGLPTVRMEADFTAISRFGDDVSLELEVAEIGRRSFTLQHRCIDPLTGQSRMSLRQTLVTTSLDSHRSIDIPADMRLAIERFTQQGT